GCETARMLRRNRALLPADDLIPAIGETEVHVVLVHVARFRRPHPAEHRREEAPYRTTCRACGSADAGRAGDSATDGARGRASRRAAASVLGDLYRLPGAQPVARPVRQLAALGYVPVHA